MVDKAIALGSDDAALNEAITNAQAVLAKEAPTTTEVITALLDLSEAMQALNTDESEDALRNRRAGDDRLHQGEHPDQRRQTFVRARCRH